MSELDEIFFEHGVILHPSDIEMDLERKTYFKQAIEAYISKYYLRKEDVLEAVGQNTDITSPTFKARNQLRAEIKEKLNIGDK